METQPSAALRAAVEGERERAISPVGAAFWGFAAVGLGAALHVCIADPPLSIHALVHLAYALFHPLFLGALLAAALAVAGPLLARRARWLAWAAAVLASIAAAALVVPDDLAHFAARVAPGGELWVIATGTLVLALLAPLAWLAGVPLRGRVLRWIGLALALGAAVAEPRVLPGLYPGLHLHGLFVAGVLGASSMRRTPFVVPERRARRAALIAAIVGGLASVLIPAPLGVRSSLARHGGALLPILPWPAPAASYAVTTSDWYRPAAERRELPPSDVPRPVAHPVVILITIDCLRADVMDRDDTRAQLAALRQLAERGAYFARAHAPGSMTVTTLTSVFTGTLFSQQRWEELPGGGGIWPHADRHVHFPELLSAAGVRTINIPGTNWIVERYGIVRGFDVEEHRPAAHRIDNDRWIHSVDSVPRLMEELSELEDEQPAFLYAHMMDPHRPYTAGGRRATPWDSYLAELARVDSQIGRLVRFLRASDLDERTYLIVTADHGEGFHEHGSTAHAYGLYQELIHVPLIVVGPGIAPRRDETLVGLMDLGPTILDLFGEPAPAQFVGQSLLPSMMGRPAELTRPVLAETRLMRALIRPDGIKVIRDVHRGTLEVYDLDTDPGEQHDLVDDLTPAMEEAIGELDAFYEAHQLREGGYEPPLRN